MEVALNQELEAFAEDQARRQGLRDAGEYVARLLEEEKKRRNGAETGRGRAAVERMRGSATSELSTDEVLAMTRSEV